MGAPDKTVQFRPDIAGSLVEFDVQANELGYIGLKVMPSFEVAIPGGKFGRIPIEQLLKDPETSRNSRAGYNRINFTFTDESFGTTENGIELPLDDRLTTIYRDYFDSVAMGALLTRATILRAMEKRIAAKLFNTTTYTGATLTTAVTNRWSDATNATPIDNVDAACEKVWALTGLWPNAIVLTQKAFRYARKTDQVKEAIMSLGAGNRALAADIGPALLGSCFDLPFVFVAKGTKNSAKEGQTAVPASIWTNSYASVLRVATTGSILEPCFGRVLHWGADGSSIGGTMDQYYSDEVRGEVLRCRMEDEEKILYTECAHLLTNIMA